MLGSSFSVADPNTVLNTIVANSLRSFYEELKDAADFDSAVQDLVKRVYSEHKRIVFNGNNYAPEWIGEAEKRGLLNLSSSPEAYDTFLLQKNIDLFASFNIFNSVEMHARYEILNEEYSKTVHIEAVTLVDMVNKQIIPAVSEYSMNLARSVRAKKSLLPDLECRSEVSLARQITDLLDELAEETQKLDEAVQAAGEFTGSDLAHYSRKYILTQMQAVRSVSDRLELIVDEKVWPYPTYGQMLFYV